MKRAHGRGEIERRVGADGKVRYRARPRVDGKKETIGTFDTEEEAEGALAVYREGLIKESPIAGESLASWSRKWLDAREVDGVHRSVKKDRHAFKRVTRHSIANLALAAVTPRDVRDWVADQVKAKAARQTIANALNLLRVCMESACERGLLDRNPALGVRVPKMARTKDAWTWLRDKEIEKLLAGDGEERDLYAVAIYTGVRAGELFGLEWRDVDLEDGVIVVRHSWRGKPTKRGKIHRVRLLRPALEAMQRQLARSGKRRHVFPARDGQPRTEDQMPNLEGALAAVGVTRHVRFHDLRHSCASHLLQGTWAPYWIARPLRLEEVKEWLGHGSIASTARYAHLCPDAVANLVVGPAPSVAPNGPKPAKVLPLKSGATKRNQRRNWDSNPG
jgi:integrase